ncbi:hypothetical protein J4H86_17430 [Spiractinospora alimapuensis]|uniref:HAAS signaling domain-containing protein n=1 Tax=Spiractinospora alimapuensis TaxID=2820884 RepID=UPI001F26B790|nr:hypothetical protein [Spiractinospora alimapuensis]QVQ50667.1 hypothetical protein J4H86_17430 [Spiractinospora alimapuensis]
MKQGVDQLLYEYLASVTAETQQHMPPQRRTRYIQEVRERIEKRRAELGVASADEMRRVLDEFGSAEQLVARDLGLAEPVEATETRPPPPANGRRPLGVLSRPVNLRRAPPPWRGGPRRTRLHQRPVKSPKRQSPPEGFEPREGILGRMSPGVVFVRCAHGVRKSPTSAAAAFFYLISAIIFPLTVFWPLAAAQVAFGGFWKRMDRWVALGVPLATTVVGMALWPGEAPYLDTIIQESFLATGVWGLRAGAFVCAFYLFVRMARIVTDIRVDAGHFPVTGDTPFRSATGKFADKSA